MLIWLCLSATHSLPVASFWAFLTLLKQGPLQIFHKFSLIFMRPVLLFWLNLIQFKHLTQDQPIHHFTVKESNLQLNRSLYNQNAVMLQ